MVLADTGAIYALLDRDDTTDDLGIIGFRNRDGDGSYRSGGI